MAAGEIGCCVFLRRPSSSSRGYRHLITSPSEGDGSFRESEAAAVRVVAGRKERREFLVDPFVLEREPFRVLMEMVRYREKKKVGRLVEEGGEAIFVDVDAIFFEHMLWSFYNDFSSDSSDSSSSSPLFRLNLRDIIEFYSQDF